MGRRAPLSAIQQGCEQLPHRELEKIAAIQVVVRANGKRLLLLSVLFSPSIHPFSINNSKKNLFICIFAVIYCGTSYSFPL